MFKKLKDSRSEGFTIIEVMIVLAIAGLIILIVLLAIPALQRNGRNTAMKNDASAIAASVSEYASNNNGTLPTVVVPNGSVIDLCSANPCPSGAGATTKATAKVQGSTVVNYETADTPTPAKYDVGNIDVDFKHKCSGSGATLAPSPRSTAIVYSVETSGTAQPACIDA
jgi:prepilin-type N-terminal cleavage/methylation domain-containing protein